MAVVFELFFELAIFVFFMGMASLTASWALLRRMRPRTVVLFGALTILLLTAARNLLSLLAQKQGLWDFFQGYFDQGHFEENWKIYAQNVKEFGLTPSDRLEASKELYQKYLYWSSPAWMIVRSLVEGLLAYYIASAVFSRVSSKISRAIHFRDWTLPEPLVFGLIAAGGLKLLGPENSWTDILSSNFLVLYLGLYLLAGLSLLSFFFAKWRIRPPFQVLGYGLAIFLAWESIFCLGLLDIWFDFRKRKSPPKAPAVEPS